MKENSFFNLRISPGITLLVLSLVGPFLYLLYVFLGYPDRIIDFTINISVALFIICPICWVLTDKNELLGRWAILLSITGLIFCSGIVWESPFVLIMAPLPVALAASLIDLTAATVIAFIETLIFSLLHIYQPIGIETYILGFGLVSIWITDILMYSAHRPVREGIYWLQYYYQKAQDSLADARDRQAELNQTLEDLADANLQLKRINSLVEGLRQAADEARMAKEQFVALVSHELRTPLNMVIGFSEIVLESPDKYAGKMNPTLRADLAVIQRNAAHLSELIDDVLDLSQIDAGRMALSKYDTSIGDLLGAAKDAVKPLFDTKGLTIEISLEETLPEVYCDRTRIREVLLNLLSNAGRFTEHGGVKMKAWRETDHVVISVSDTGPGIDPEKRKLLFQPFQQLDGSISQRYGGTGLGLSISKRFIEMHGGNIWVESNAEGGTTFLFRLPLMLEKPVDKGFRRA